MKTIKLGYLLLLALIPIVLATGLVRPLGLDEACDTAPQVPKDSTFTIKDKMLLLEERLKYRINFRNKLVESNSALKYRLFKSSMNTSQVVIGKEDWLYYSSPTDKIVDSYTHLNNYTSEELSDFISELEQRQERLKNKKIQYCHAVWPNKSTIYPEYMPNRYRNQKKEKPSRMSEFYEANRESNLTLVDVRETFLSIKDSTRIYLKHDTHWNALGAYYAYCALIKKLGLEPYPLNDFEFTWATRTKGDLLSLIGLCNIMTITEQIPVLKYKGDKKVEKIERQGSAGDLFRCVNADSNKTLLMFRDSFGTALKPFLSLHFQDAYFPWKGYKLSIVNEINPDIVICAGIERYL